MNLAKLKLPILLVIAALVSAIGTAFATGKQWEQHESRLNTIERNHEALRPRIEVLEKQSRDSAIDAAGDHATIQAIKESVDRLEKRLGTRP